MSDETLEMLTAAVRRFAREELIPAEAQVEEDDDIPETIVRQLKQLGVFGMTIPREYGGLGLTMYEEARVVFEIGYASPVFRSYFGTSNGVGTLGIIIDGTEEQRRRYLPKIATGDMIASFCLTEPDAGSDAAALSTRAARDGDHYVINGTKRFTTNSPHAGIFTVFARTAPKQAGVAGISAFLVERSAPGITVAPPYKKMGFRGAHTADVIFEDCRVPADALLGSKEGIGFKTAMKSLDHARIHMAAVAVGLCARLIDEGMSYAMQRRQFGKPIAEFQLIQAMLADSESRSARGARDGREGGARHGCGDAHHQGVGVLQVLRDRSAGPHRRPRAADPRRLRLHQGIPGRTAVPRCTPAADLRRHQPDPAADRGARDDQGKELAP